MDFKVTGWQHFFWEVDGCFESTSQLQRSLPIHFTVSTWLDVSSLCRGYIPVRLSPCPHKVTDSLSDSNEPQVGETGRQRTHFLFLYSLLVHLTGKTS